MSVPELNALDRVVLAAGAVCCALLLRDLLRDALRQEVRVVLAEEEALRAVPAPRAPRPAEE